MVAVDARAELTRVAIFYVIAFALALLVAIAPIPNDPKPALYMLPPAIAVLIMLLVVTRDGYTRSGWADLGLHRAGLRRWPAAIFVPVALVGSAYSMAWLSGALTPVEGIGNPRLTSVILDTVVSIAVGSATFMLSEELGWSGYLLPRLSVLGQERAGLVRGVLHAVWHFPLIFLTTTYLIHGNRLVTVPLFVVTLTCAGLAYAYLRFSTDSVWPGAIAHAAFNHVSGAFDGLTDQSTPDTAAYLVGEGGILMAAGAIVLAAWAIWRLRGSEMAATPAGAASAWQRLG